VSRTDPSPAELDAVIIGAGPAGAIAGLALAPHARVLLVDRVAEPAARIGESLVPAARRILADFGLLGLVEAEGYPAYLGNRAHWGGGVEETDFLRDPSGPGWHLDRRRFERLLRQAAGAAGCRITAPAKLDRLEPTAAGWSLSITDGARTMPLSCRVLIDASGRAATVTKRLGVARHQADRLTARWLHGTVAAETRSTAGFSLVESVPGGWWYSAPLADHGRVLSFHSDGDLMPETDDLLALADRAPAVAALLRETGFRARGPAGTTAANTVWAARAAGQDRARSWLAIGDAALAFDPLSSRGVFNALYTGLSGGFAAARMLAGEPGAAADYQGEIDRIRHAYQRHLALCYAAEPRWPDQPFWRRRLSSRQTAAVIAN